jgi:hypothetical protein
MANNFFKSECILLKKENVFIKTALITALILTVSTMIFAQTNRYTFEERQRQLDSLEFLQQEAMRSGGDTNFIAEMRQLQAIIKTEIEINRREFRGEQTPLATETQTTSIANFIENTYNSFMGRPVLDKLIIGMGALAVLAAIFLIFTRLFLAILQNSKKRPPKKQILPKKQKQETKQTPIPPAPAPTPTLETAIYSLRELASKYPSPPKQTPPVRLDELLRIDLPTQAAEPQKTEAPQVFEIPTKTEILQAFETPTKVETPQIFQEQPKVEIPQLKVEIEQPRIEIPPIQTPPTQVPPIQAPLNPPRASDIKSEIIQRFDENEDIGKIAQEFKMSKDQVTMILRLAGRKS